MRAAIDRSLARAVDALLEASVVGSFTRIGPALRSRTAHWAPPRSARGRVIVVSGATSGLGLEASTQLSGLGAEVCLVGRDAEKLDTARRRVGAAGGPPATIEQADLGDLDQVEQLAQRLMARFDQLDVLVHNAGALLAKRATSPQGIERTVAVHLLAPYLLTERLLPLLAASAPARVITMTSGGMYTQRFDLEKLVVPDEGYRGSVAYARAKRAQVVLTHEWQRRYAGSGIDFYVVHPGWADTPGLSAGLPHFAKVLHPLLRPAAEGVDTEVWLATAPEGATHGGQLWLDRQPRGDDHLPWTWVPPAARAAQGRSLWEWCRAQVAL